MSSLRDGLGSRNRVRKNSLLFCWSRGIIEPAELLRWHSCWCIVALGTRALQKPSLFFFQQDSAPSHGAKKTQEWLSENVPHFITKEESLDFGIWPYLESKVSTVHHQSFEALKVKLRKKWVKISQEVIRDSCKAFSKRLQLVIDADGGHIEWYFGNCLSKPYST